MYGSVLCCTRVPVGTGRLAGVMYARYMLGRMSSDGL